MMKRRAGYSLIELVVVMTVGAMMLGVAVGLLAMLLRTECAARDHLYHCTVLGRLADQFRRDAHAANAGNVDGPQRMQLELALNRTVTYHRRPGRIVRVEQVGQTAERRESFALPPAATASFEVHIDTTPTIASLAITRTTGESGQLPSATLRIDAVLGSDHRFTKPKEP